MFMPQCLGGGDEHLYWRIVSTAAPYPLFNAAEIEMRASVGGADQCNGGTAAASSNSFGAPAWAFDNSTAQWTSSDPLPQWIAYQFPSPVAVHEVALTCATHLLSAPLASPTALDVEWSNDGTTWYSTTGGVGFTASWSGASPETKTFSIP